MPLTARRHDSGLILAENAMDERAIGRAIKQIRPDCALQLRARDEAKGGVSVYKIVHVPSGHIVFTWMDAYGRPLPLSSGLVEEFKRHLSGERTDLEDVDAYNARVAEEARRDNQREIDSIIADHRARVERGQLQVSLAHRNRKPQWLKANGGRLVR